MSQIAKVFALLAFFAIFSYSGPVSVYGQLNTNGNKIVGSKWGADNTVQVRGISMGWSNTGWESARFFNATTVNALVDEWKAEIIRAPLGYSENGGYQTDASNKERVKAVIDAAIAKDVYIIIDWHSHNAHNETTAAKAYFKEMAEAYGDKDHVIFEIYNEPTSATWTQIKTYASEIITEIRKHSDNLILVGTPQWSLKVDEASRDPLSGSNIGYVFHFYAASHSTTSEGVAITTAQNNGVPVFVTEYGTVSSDGAGQHNGTASDTWMTFLNGKKISFCAWQVSNKSEASAFFTSQNQVNSSYPFTTSLSASGTYVYNKLKGWANSTDEPWRGSTTPPSSSSNGGGSASSTTTLIDDFQDEDGLANTYEPWYIYTDKDDSGASTVSNEKDEDGNYITVNKESTNSTNWVAYIKSYSLKQGGNKYEPYVAIGLNAKNNQKATSAGGYDLSKCTGGFSYKYKGVAHNFKVKQTDVEDYAYHYREVGVASNNAWTTLSIPLSDIAQPTDWGVKKTLDLKKVDGFDWEIKGGLSSASGLSGLTGSLMIDDFTCLGNMPLPPPPEGQSSSSGAGASSSSSKTNNSSSSAGKSSNSNNSSSSGYVGNSSSSGSSTPILLSPIATKNAMQLISNGISLQAQSSAVLEIFNMNGTLLRKMDFSNGVYSVEFSDLPKGLYIAKIRFGNSNKEILKVPVR